MLQQTKAKFGSIVPLWIAFPDIHPLSMEWRMGSGESYAIAWHSWWREQSFSHEQKVAYFRHYAISNAWLENVIHTLYEAELIEEFGEDNIDDLDEKQLIPYFKKLEQLELGSCQDWQAGYNSNYQANENYNAQSSTAQ